MLLVNGKWQHYGDFLRAKHGLPRVPMPAFLDQCLNKTEQWVQQVSAASA